MLEGDVMGKIAEIRARAGLSSSNIIPMPEPRSEVLRCIQVNKSYRVHRSFTDINCKLPLLCRKKMLGQGWQYTWSGCAYDASMNLALMKEIYVEGHSCVLVNVMVKRIFGSAMM
jgi:hypothetical protein